MGCNFTIITQALDSDGQWIQINHHDGGGSWGYLMSLCCIYFVENQLTDVLYQEPVYDSIDCDDYYIISSSMIEEELLRIQETTPAPELIIQDELLKFKNDCTQLLTRPLNVKDLRWISDRSDKLWKYLKTTQPSHLGKPSHFENLEQCLEHITELKEDDYQDVRYICGISKHR